MRRITVIILLLSLGVVPCLAQSPEYRLQPTDVLKITVHDQVDLDTTTRITAEGYITFPLIGKVKAEGLTVRELEAEIKRLLELDYLVTAQVLIFIQGYHTRQVSVLGEVNLPGKYDMPEEKTVTLLQAIAMAGGFTKDALTNETQVMREKNGQTQTMIVRVNDITKRGMTEKDMAIEPGDVVFVPESFFWVSVIGEVNTPGKYNIPEEKSITLLEAIALAGGFTKDADINQTQIMRVTDGQTKTIIVRVSDITKKGQKDQDIAIEPEDVIFVPESFF
ncbi:MAG: polysaccharide export protein [Candidatus Omnitrophica bacterium]|nr:polysaccharide export protein [Candidatus Omnitrophota bacterium]